MREKGTDTVGTGRVHNDGNGPWRYSPGNSLGKVMGFINGRYEGEMSPGVLALGKWIGEGIGPYEKAKEKDTSYTEKFPPPR